MQQFNQNIQQLNGTIISFKNFDITLPEDLSPDPKLVFTPNFSGPPNQYQEGDNCDKLLAFLLGLLIIGIFVIITYLLVIWVINTDSYTYSLIWISLGLFLLLIILAINSKSKYPKSYKYKKMK